MYLYIYGKPLYNLHFDLFQLTKHSKVTIRHQNMHKSTIQVHQNCGILNQKNGGAKIGKKRVHKLLARPKKLAQSFSFSSNWLGRRVEGHGDWVRSVRDGSARLTIQHAIVRTGCFWSGPHISQGTSQTSGFTHMTSSGQAGQLCSDSLGYLVDLEPVRSNRTGQAQFGPRG